MGIKDASVFRNKKEMGLPRSAMTSTRWSEEAAAGKTWQEYPRPMLVREEWINLNGHWDYAIRKNAERKTIFSATKKMKSCTNVNVARDTPDGKILVPFSPESRLSGVNRQLQPDEELYYYRRVMIPRMKKGEHYLLHFGAVDQYCEVYVNGVLAGSHSGGYLPFTLSLDSVLDKISHNGGRTSGFSDCDDKYEKVCKNDKYEEVYKNEYTGKIIRLRTGMGAEEMAQTGLGNMMEFDLSLIVRDVSDSSYHSRGKQKLQRGGMYYTAQSGIWQTVWIEKVAADYIKDIKVTPDLDRSCLFVRVDLTKEKATNRGLLFYINDRLVLRSSRTRVRIPLKDVHAWTPEDPYLYRLRIQLVKETEEEGMLPSEKVLISEGIMSSKKVLPLEKALPLEKVQPADDVMEVDSQYDITKDSLCGACKENVIDQVESYFAMRKITVEKDAHGIPRFFLNHQLCVHSGLLDQGYWCDGLYTAPSDEALVYDIQTVKNLGFNMIRKHIKVEPQRWYYHCDRLGMLVWQDMVNGGTSYQDWLVTYLTTVLNIWQISIPDGIFSRALLSRRSAKGRREFVNEMRASVKCLYNHPCIVTWVPFNEGWGQFDARRICKLLRRLDPGRLIDHASGWYDQGAGDVKSLHHYFFKLHVRPEKKRALALSEFGGYTWKMPGHSFSEELYGYGAYESGECLSAAFEELWEKEVLDGFDKGMSAFVYTQLSDIEDEANGILTYDRACIKIDAETVRRCNRRLEEKYKPQI